VTESTVAVKCATVAEISEWFSVVRQLIFRMARRMACRTAQSHRLTHRIAYGIACRMACRIIHIIARRITRRIACGIACEITGGIARGVAVSEGASASRPTLRSDDNRLMLTDEWLHHSMRNAQVWAVVLAGRPLYAKNSDALSGWRYRRTRCGSKKLRLKKRECKDETQKRGTKWQIQRVRLLMGIRLAERSIRAHNLLEYRDR